MSNPINASFAPLHALTHLINTSLSTLESTCSSLNVPWFNLSEPSYASQTGLSKDDLARMQSAAIAEAAATIVAAAMQLICSVQEPGLTGLRTGLGVSHFCF